MISDKIHRSESLQRIAAPLLAWYGKNCRDLEWRREPLPYYVWVSEIMLQQTRVEAVKPYFSRFIGALPDIPSLAACPEEKLLKLWEGLGYYNRVRNLKKAAQLVVREYEGALPGDVNALRRLPGIGSYTAGAIASIAFGIPAPAVDGNVLRILSRIDANESCIDDGKVKAAFEDRIRMFLQARMEQIHPGRFNQALMELGALVCAPNGKPSCEDCPVEEMCLARKRNLTGSIPVRKEKKARRQEEKTVLVITDRSNVLIGKRQDKGLLAGLWEFPNYSGHLSYGEALLEAKKHGVSALRIQPLPDDEHIFTHVTWRMSGYLIQAEEMDALRPGERFKAVRIEKIEEEYSIPSAFSRFSAYLKGEEGTR